jgi:2-iminobutanoate/2-iminopropanoate deaminase
MSICAIDEDGRMKLGVISMAKSVRKGLLTAAVILFTTQVEADSLEYLGKPLRDIPVSQAVKVGKLVFVSGTPGYGGDRKVAVGDFSTQMKQVMENISAVLKTSGADWSRVAKTTVFLVRPGDFTKMSEIYALSFSDGKFPARTTVVLSSLPSPDFLVEIEVEAVLE